MSTPGPTAVNSPKKTVKNEIEPRTKESLALERKKKLPGASDAGDDAGPPLFSSLLTNRLAAMGLERCRDGKFEISLLHLSRFLFVYF